MRVNSLHRPKGPFGSGVIQQVHIRFAHINQRRYWAKALSVGDQPINSSPALNHIRDQVGGGSGIGSINRPSQMIDVQARQLGVGRSDTGLFASSHHHAGTAAS